ncbi:MAG: hypothetical protein HC896_08020 [Bacteroidales bacterium]|nr:hypothetical protein [Bacteroidales bacterium]
MYDDAIMKAMVEGREAERNRVAKDLHDGLGQISTAIVLNLKALEDEIESTIEHDKLKLLHNTINLSETLIEEIKFISYNLFSYELEDFGLIYALESLFEKVPVGALGNIDFRHKNIANNRFRPSEETYLYRISQEILNNTIKHARANNLVFDISYGNGEIVLHAKDDGIGLEDQPDNHQRNKGRGLKIMATNVKLMHGVFSFSGQNGMEININVPVHPVGQNSNNI